MNVVRRLINKSNRILKCISLQSVKNDDPDLINPLANRGMKGYYVRPSRAIEKGGGFFVPGLEGEKIRIISAWTLGIMTIINLQGTPLNRSLQLLISASIGSIIILLLFAQGFITSGGESFGENSFSDNKLVQIESIELSNILNALGIEINSVDTNQENYLRAVYKAMQQGDINEKEAQEICRLYIKIENGRQNEN